MTDRRTETTPASSLWRPLREACAFRRRCPWCGHRCHGKRTCIYCVDLGTGYNAAGNRAEIPPLDPHALAERLPAMRDELRQAVKR